MASPARIIANRAHPRVSGENTSLALLKADSAGSSPRERGKLSAAGVALGGLGLIPA